MADLLFFPTGGGRQRRTDFSGIVGWIAKRAEIDHAPVNVGRISQVLWGEMAQRIYRQRRTDFLGIVGATIWSSLYVSRQRRTDFSGIVGRDKAHKESQAPRRQRRTDFSGIVGCICLMIMF